MLLCAVKWLHLFREPTAFRKLLTCSFTLSPHINCKQTGMMSICVVIMAAGKQAEVLNQVINELMENHPVVGEIKLKEVLGHTPRQVSRIGS